MTRLFDYETNKMIHEDDPVKVNELIDSGKAKALDLSELDRFEYEANDIYETFQNQREKIKNNDNPLYTEEVKKFEIAKLEKEYREKSAEVEEKYQDYRKQSLHDTKIGAAQAVIEVKDADRTVASQFATRYKLNLAVAGDKGVKLSEMSKEIALLSDSQRVALQSEILDVLNSVDDEFRHDKQRVIAATQAVKNEDILAHTVAKQLPHTVLTKQNMHDIVTKTVANGGGTLGGGGVDREFYEKHIKGDDK